MTTYTTWAKRPLEKIDVIDVALITLTNNGFRIEQRDEVSTVVTSPGYNSTKQNPLLGASRVTLRSTRDRLSLDAELGGAEAMSRFVHRFPLLLGLVLGLAMGVFGGLTFGRQFGIGFGVPWAPGWKWMIFAIAGAMLPVAPWLVIAPMMSKKMRKQTELALDTLVRNAVA